MTEFTHTITIEDDGLEVKDVMRRHFDLSARLRNKIKRENLVTLNGNQTEGWHRVSPGDVLKISLPDEKSHFEPQPIPIAPVFEDEHLLIINKQPGLVVHPTKGHPSGTIANALMYYMDKTGQSFKIRFVNRLDMDTSGLLVIAKNAYCQDHYTRQMKENKVEKRYIAILTGIMENEFGVIDLPIGRPDPDDVKRAVTEDGAPSTTYYRVLQRYDKSGYTLAELRLKTGRTHQIRVHMSYIGHPILGDRLYGGENISLIDRQALHAAELSFTHPITGKRLIVTAPLPKDMTDVAAKLK